MDPLLRRRDAQGRGVGRQVDLDVVEEELPAAVHAVALAAAAGDEMKESREEIAAHIGEVGIERDIILGEEAERNVADPQARPFHQRQGRTEATFRIAVAAPVRVKLLIVERLEVGMTRR